MALQRISPKIWRRIQLLSSQSLADLHFAIQLVMGWTDEFQHQFLIRNHRLGIGRPGGHVLFGNPRELRLQQFGFRSGERFLYEYNFFDEWRLDVRFEGERPWDPQRRYPYCVAGAQRAPKEDCGGPVPFMERWQRASTYERAAYARDTVIKLSALLEDTRLEARACREQALVMLKRHAPASFDRTGVNRRLGLYADGKSLGGDMQICLQIVIDGDESTRTEIASFERSTLSAETLGLQLVEAKKMLAATQSAMVESQVTEHLRKTDRCAACGRSYRRKGQHTMVVRSLFGKLELSSPRWYRCALRCAGRRVIPAAGGNGRLLPRDG